MNKVEAKWQSEWLKQDLSLAITHKVLFNLIGMYPVSEQVELTSVKNHTNDANSANNVMR